MVIIALLIIAISNIAVTQLRASYSLKRDARRLRLALAEELRQLGFLHDKNIRFLRKSEPHLMSSRACTLVYRSNISRIVLIPDREISALVRAYAVSEQAEHLIAATTKASGSMAFRVIEGETPVREIARELERSNSAIAEALAILELGRQNWWSRLGQAGPVLSDDARHRPAM